jgi:mRNA-degrading endonuclease RelE of RelBE toxin-antitoxin system
VKFKVEYTKRAVRDLKSFQPEQQTKIVRETIRLEDNPFPARKKIKRIQGIKFPCYRLRIDTGSDTFRVFYGIKHEIIFILCIVAKKDAERVLKNLKNVKFPPNFSY